MRCLQQRRETAPDGAVPGILIGVVEGVRHVDIHIGAVGEHLSWFVQAGGATARSVEQVEVTCISYRMENIQH